MLDMRGFADSVFPRLVASAPRCLMKSAQNSLNRLSQGLQSVECGKGQLPLSQA